MMGKRIIMVVAALAAASAGDDLVAFVDGWCAKTGGSREPRVVVYNRIEKTGSTTLTELLRAFARQRVYVDGSVVNLGPAFWHDAVLTSPARRAQLVANVANALARAANETVVAIGHLDYGAAADLAPGDFGGEAIGRFNVFRSCDARTRSALVYHAADKANATACAATDDCSERQRATLAREASAQRDRALTARDGTVDVARALRSYDAVGLVEDLAGTLDVMHCAFPSLFTHRPRPGARGGPRMNACDQKARACAARGEAVSDRVRALCAAGDDAAVAAARALFGALLARIRAPGGRACCRTARPPSAAAPPEATRKRTKRVGSRDRLQAEKFMRTSLVAPSFAPA
jgi:hypothetical protein